MPLVFRPAADRGQLRDPGLSGAAAFSHGSAFDRRWLGFGALRVLNRLELAPGVRLPAARRANMEVLSLVLAGTYRCASQAGDSGPVRAGQWHRLGAGVGVDVVEENLDTDATLRLLQLWVQPTHSNALPVQAVGAPGIGTSLVAGPAAGALGGEPAQLPWRAAATVRRESVVPGASFAAPATQGSACWIEVIGGELAFRRRGDEGIVFLRGGDGMGVHDEPAFALPSSFGADLLVIGLPG